MQINIQYLQAMQRYNRRKLWIVAILFVLILGCTEKEVAKSHVLELRAIPEAITLSDKYFYPKPFTIRAKYSDKTEKNISSRVSWLSENIALLSINKKGELHKNAECLQRNCVVSLIATDPESGKSIRLTVNLSPKKDQAERQKKSYRKPLPVPEQKQESFDSGSEVLENINEEVVEQKKMGNGIENLQFSPQPDSTPISISAITSNAQLQKPIVPVDRIIFEEKSIELFSGESYQPKPIAIDKLDKLNVNHKIPYECYITEAFNLSIIVLPDCQLIAVKPGDSEIRIKLNDDGLSGIESDALLKIRVNPIVINLIQKELSYQIKLLEHNFQIWYQVSNLDNFSYYKAKLFSNVSEGLRLFVFTHPSLQFPTCLNTLPEKSNSVACYFQEIGNDVLIVVENMLEKNIQTNLNLKSADSNLFQNQALDLQSPIKLELNRLVSNFIFANESGRNNKHYYAFEKNNMADKDLIIKIYDFSEVIKMTVNWSEGFCNNRMIKIQGNEVFCRVPASVSDKLRITIDGNNGEFGVLNGPAATEGGTFYKVLVKYIE